MQQQYTMTELFVAASTMSLPERNNSDAMSPSNGYDSNTATSGNSKQEQRVNESLNFLEIRQLPMPSGSVTGGPTQ
jgi:hypothetical protein